jgi:hypothetical protein
VVFDGIATLEGGGLYVDRGDGKPRFEIWEEWLGRIRSVEPESREILLNADYCLSLTVSNLASDERWSWLRVHRSQMAGLDD